MTFLAQIGEALWGPRWQSELARSLGVADRTVRRWTAGDTTPAPGVYADLLDIAKERNATITKAIARLERVTRG